MKTARLFVYGTLRSGEPNHPELGGARCVGRVLTQPRCAVVELEGYPALIRGNAAVPGEVYELDERELARLDAFEGAGYVRAPVELLDGTSADAYWAASDAE